MPPPIDLLQCSASELSSYLYEHRFQNDGMATTTFLLEGTTTLPDAEAIAAQIQGDQQEQSPSSETKSAAILVTSQSEESIGNLGEAKHSQPIELSMINPRGRFNVTLHEHGIQFCTVKNPQYLSLPSGCVRSAIVFPKPTDCQTATKKAGAPIPSPLMLLTFQENEDDNKLPTFKGKPMNQICFPVPSSLENLQLGGGTNNVVDAWIQSVCESLGINPQKSVYRIHNPADATNTTTSSGWKFQSHQEAGTSTTLDGMPFVKCYHGVQDGCLYPMKEGLLFFKPPLFVPRSNLHSIACGRGAGASSRYVDMNIVTNDDVSLEFTNINRAEIGVLNDYIHKVLIPAMEKDGQNNEEEDEDATEVAMVVETGENEEDAVDVKVASSGQEEEEEDSDGSDGVEVVGTKPGRGCRSKRRAAREAIQTTKQHYMKRQAASNNDDEEEEDSEDDAPYQFQPEPASDNEDGESSEEDEDFEGNDDDDEDEESGGEVEVVVEDNEEETEDEDDDDDEAPPKKRQRGKR